ncbi:unnamed protein product [Blepharisma stoltei]|uniref:Uncharacterized protein n=1 Tax=Blepharisma stoltei TaxID=1481888 RepID=A0AAU9JPN1_9CILI|nr:unnamed protein product [Blepharisma stoltei]
MADKELYLHLKYSRQRRKTVISKAYEFLYGSGAEKYLKKSRTKRHKNLTENYQPILLQKEDVFLDCEEIEKPIPIIKQQGNLLKPRKSKTETVASIYQDKTLLKKNKDEITKSSSVLKRNASNRSISPLISTVSISTLLLHRKKSVIQFREFTPVLLHKKKPEINNNF